VEFTVVALFIYKQHTTIFVIHKALPNILPCKSRTVALSRLKNKR